MIYCVLTAFLEYTLAHSFNFIFTNIDIIYAYMF